MNWLVQDLFRLQHPYLVNQSLSNEKKVKIGVSVIFRAGLLYHIACCYRQLIKEENSDRYKFQPRKFHERRPLILVLLI